MPDYRRLPQIREKRPLLHCISNIVSANDCANLALAIGASPMMAQAPEEMEEITRLSAATVLNTGTPDAARFEACRICAREAARLHQPVILDPVGAGAGSWRLGHVKALLAESPVSILRVNPGEARALLIGEGREQGVDSIGQSAEEERIALAAALAEKYRTAVLLSGVTDLVHDGTKCYRVSGGSSRMSGITGAGCMLNVICGAFASVEADMAEAAALASSFWKRCAEDAQAAAGHLGPGSFRNALLDAAFRMDPAHWEAGSRIELL